MANPYQSPQQTSARDGASRDAAGPGGLFVECECGKRTGVSTAAAGSHVTCGCGRTVSVPRLSELRRMCGQAAYVTNAVEAARVLLRDSYVPGNGLCLACGAPAHHTVNFDVQCEQTYNADSRSGFGQFLLVLAAMAVHSLLIWRYLMRTDDLTPTVHGRDTSIRLPVALCDRCQTDSRFGQSRGARELLSRVAEYAEIFREYPAAVAKRV